MSAQSAPEETRLPSLNLVDLLLSLDFDEEIAGLDAVPLVDAPGDDLCFVGARADVGHTCDVGHAW
jgi:hypothetical protein